MNVNIDASKVSVEELAKMIDAEPNTEVRINVTHCAVEELRSLADDLESGKKKLKQAEIISLPEMRDFFIHQFVVGDE